MNDEELLVYMCVCDTLVCCSFIMFVVVRDRVFCTSSSSVL